MKKLFLLLIPALAFSQVATSIKPLSLLVGEIYPGEVITVVPPHRSPHIFSPAPREVRRILRAKLVFKIGAGLEPWKIPGAREVDLSVHVPLIKKGERPNPHYWLSPRRMLKALPAIERYLEEAFPEMKEKIESRAQKTTEELKSLDEELRRMLGPFSGRKIILYRPAWVYLLKDYGLGNFLVLTPDPSRPPTPGKMSRLKGDLIIFDPSIPEEKAKILADWAKIPWVLLDPLAETRDFSSYSEFILENARQLVEGLK